MTEYAVVPGQDFFVAYMDSCPAEVLLTPIGPAWHTAALVYPRPTSTTAGLFSTIDPLESVAAAFRTSSVHLRKWSSKKASFYRKRFRAAIPNAIKAEPFGIFAFSFRADQVLATVPDVLERLDLADLTTFREQDGKRRFRLGPFRRGDRQQYFFDVVENELAPLLAIADALTQSFLLQLTMAPTDGQYVPVILLWTDLLAGDTHADKRRTEFVQHAISRRIHSAEVKVQVNATRSQHIGDVLADNIAGWLNGFLTEPRQDIAASIVECERSAPLGTFVWTTYSASPENLLLRAAAALAV